MIPERLHEIAEELNCAIAEDDTDVEDIIAWLTEVANQQRAEALMEIEEKFARLHDDLAEVAVNINTVSPEDTEDTEATDAAS